MVNNKGFTLIEILAVLLVVGIIAGTVAYKLIDLGGSASHKAAVYFVSELNQLEKHAWLNCKLDSNCVPTDLLPTADPDFINKRSPTGDGASLRKSGANYVYTINNKEFVLVYTEPSTSEPAKWKLKQ